MVEFWVTNSLPLPLNKTMNNKAEQWTEWIIGMRPTPPKIEPIHLEPPIGFEEGHNYEDENCKLRKI